jgi:chaperone BCS1
MWARCKDIVSNTFPHLRKGVNLMGVEFMIGSGIGVGAFLFSKLSAVMSRLFVSKAIVTSKDEAFHWIMLWLAQHEYSKHANHFSVLTSKTYFDFSTHFFNAAPTEKDKHKIPVKFIPAPGNHIVSFNGKYLLINYSKHVTGPISGTSNNEVGTIEFLTVSTFGYNPKFLRSFIEHCQETYIKSKHGKTLVYVPDTFCDNWEPRICRFKRDSSTVVLKGNILQEIKADATKFLSSHLWYHERGIPFRRGYLLYGPPGTGKSSAVAAVAGDLDMNICMVNLTAKNLDDDKLNSLLLSTPYNSIILLEDIDHALEGTHAGRSLQRVIPEDVNDNDNLDDFRTPVSLAGLLNCIDGVIAQEGRLVFMTTNRPQRLPQALTRPGRVDVQYLIDYADEDQCERMFLNFYPGHNDNARKFVQALRQAAAPLQTDSSEKIDVAKTPIHNVTTARLQGHFLKYKDLPDDAVKNADEVLQQTAYN